MRIEFPLHEIETQFGSLLDPTIELPVKTPRGFRLFSFIVDSGADFTMMPRSVSEQLGINLEAARELKVAGVEGTLISAWLSEIELNIGDSLLRLPCLFSSKEDTPYLLGRMGFFHRFNVTFDNRGKKIILESIVP